jgi:hypothetical protein
VLVQYARGTLRDKGSWHPTLLHKDSGWLVFFSGQSIFNVQAEGRRFSVSSSSTNPTLQVALQLRGYSTSVSCDNLFTYVVSTYQKRASAIPPLDLPLVSIGIFLDGMMIFSDSVQFGGSSTTTAPCLHFKPLDLHFRSLMFDFVCAHVDFLLWIPVNPP